MSGLKSFWIALAALCCVAGAALAGPITEFIPQANGEVKWSEGVLRATGFGVRPKDADTPAQARLLARSAAIADAYRNMAQVINEVRVTANTTVERHLTLNDTLRLSVQAYIRGAEVVEERDNADGTYTIVLQVGFFGKNGLTGMVLPGVLRSAARVDSGGPPGITLDLPALTPPATAAVAVAAVGAVAVPGMGLETDLLTAATDEGPFTGVIIDARGLNVQPAMSPRIYDPAGKEIYGTVGVDASFAEDVGVAGYMGTVRAAMALPRVGNRPLVIRAAGTPDTFHRYLTISGEDAQRLLAADAKSHFLQKCAVTIVVDERRTRDETK